MKSAPIPILAFLVSLFLAACSGTATESVRPPVQIPAKDKAQTTVQEADPSTTQPGTVADQLTSPTSWPDGQGQLDNQGQVEVAVTPLNLGQHDETLDFDVAMNTHSVDLNMDLANLATLRTDTGLTVNATAWSAPGGGHHVSGMISFPALVDGEHILDDVSRLTLTIRDVDAPERVFTWSLGE